MENLIKIDTVDQYNKMFGLETLHPLVSVVDLSKSETWPTNFRVNYGIYGLFLKDTKCGDIRYGRQYYDYQEGKLDKRRIIKNSWYQMTEVSYMAFTLDEWQEKGVW